MVLSIFLMIKLFWFRKKREAQEEADLEYARQLEKLEIQQQKTELEVEKRRVEEEGRARLLREQENIYETIKRTGTNYKYKKY